MKKIFFLSIVLTYSALAQQIWKPVSTVITFKIKHAAGASASGSFKGFSGTVNFDKENLASASIKASLDANTIDTENSMRDKEMRSSDYFDVQKYRKITMVSTKIEKGKDLNDYVGTFNLTIKNITKTITLPFSFIQDDNKAVFKGSFSLNRIEYGVGGKSFLLSDTPTIAITLNVQK